MMYSKYRSLIVRSLSTSVKKPKVCIVGAGPAGFYAAMHVTKNLPNVTIDLIEKLPVPFGLIRFGVAPDHPEVKNCINQFNKVAQLQNVNFYGNITLGRDIKLTDLRLHYDAVLMSYGAEEDKFLNIVNENSRNVIAARRFVGWYNGLPSDADLEIDLTGTVAAIVGQGNVALDVARIILTPIDKLKNTDITEHALSVLADSKIKEVYLVGRRGPLQVAFTIKELREQLKLENCDTIWRNQDFNGVADIVPSLQRPRKRLTELMLKSVNENCQYSNERKCFKPIFFRSPEKILLNKDNNVSGIELMTNKLLGNSLDEQKCLPTDEKEILNCDLIFRSIGYKSNKVDDGILFDEHRGLISNSKGRVSTDDDDLGKLYAAGWVGTGPVGVILHTMSNAFQVAKTICEDINSSTKAEKGGFEEIIKLLSKENVNIVDWTGWEKINAYEIEQGKKVGKPREKICNVKSMLDVALS